MIQLIESEKYTNWLEKLRDVNGRSRINARIDRLACGLTGDSKSVGGGVFELRIDCGPGYRIYYMWRGKELIVLLAGGDKSSQVKDINVAKKLAEQYSKENR